MGEKITNKFFKASFYYFLFVILTPSFGQEKCATVPINQRLTENYGNYSDEVFEAWLARKSRQIQARTSSETYQIPVVIHIIHNGEDEGTELNIPNEQVLSQIETLNKDFRRANSDTLNTPEEFLLLAVDTQIEFTLAKQDPLGVPTDGIVRVYGGQSSWSALNEEAELKALSYWPADSYLNIWVTALEDNVLGFAQFPISDELEGLETAIDDAETDGVVVDYRYFGTGFNTLETSRGRTLTHEVGHYLGLRHIWGDPGIFQDGCEIDDYCTDTPVVSSSFSGCNLNNLDQIICESRPMIENYMDYTNDECMNLFTSDQLFRMETVLQNSPRRTSLPSSLGLEEPIVYENDLALLNIDEPGDLLCESFVAPVIVVQNLGSNAVTFIDIRYTINEMTKEASLSIPTLGYLETTVIEIPQIQIEVENELIIEISKVNNSTDERLDNNSSSTSFSQITSGSFPVVETFEVLPENWIISNSDEDQTWSLTKVELDDEDEFVLFMDNYFYDAPGEEDALVSPFFELNRARVDSLILKLDYSYARSPFGNDALEIRVYDGCENFSLERYQVVYNRAGAELSTSDNISFRDSFVPEESNEWETLQMDLLPYITESDFVVAIVSINDYGNNLYVDNLQIKYFPEIAESTFLAYPNPVTDLLTIEFTYQSEAPLQWYLYDLSGKLLNDEIIAKTADGVLNLNLEMLESNIYLLRLIGDGIDETKRIIFRGK